MAGAGYKLFNTGDVLTAAQVNTYLMEQTVMVFASSTARTTALSGVLAEGMISYLQDTNAVQVYNGSAWVNVGEAGDITEVIAGTGISGGGTSGAVTVTNSMATAINAKGDLIAGTADNAFDRLAAGSNGDTLVADSSASTGLRWNPSYQAGKNFIINGGFDIWQRGTSFTTSNTGSGYNADRWTYFGGGTGTITRSTALLRDGAQFALRFTSTSAAGNADIYQLIETLNTVQLQGKTVTVSVYVAGTAGKTAQVLLGSSTTDDDGLFGSYTTLTPSGTSSVTTTGSYQRITAQFTIPSNSRTLRLGLNHGSLANTEFISWAQVMLEVGSTATNFSRAGGNIAGELAACQRYYYRQGGNEVFQKMGAGIATASNGVAFLTIFPVQMRVRPTSIDFASVKAADTVNTPLTMSSVTLTTNESSQNNGWISATVSGASQFRPYFLQADNTTAAYVAFNAEL